MKEKEEERKKEKRKEGRGTEEREGEIKGGNEEKWRPGAEIEEKRIERKKWLDKPFHHIHSLSHTQKIREKAINSI